MDQISYASPNRGSGERTLYYASVTIHPCDKVRFPTVGKQMPRNKAKFRNKVEYPWS